VVVLTCASASGAQQRTTLRKIEIVGLQRLTPEQVVATSGLKIGELVEAATVDNAMDNLMRTGWFTSVNYRVRSANSETTVTFEVIEKVTPTAAATGDMLDEVVWSGNSALSNQELSSAFGLRRGEAASRAKIDQGLDGVKKAYGRRGYINAQIAEAVTRDSVNRRASYEFTIREDQQYRMGVLTVTGLNGIDTRSLRGKWTLATGAVFDDAYLEQFRTTVLRPFVASRTQRTGIRSQFEMNSKPDTQKQTVDVIITFK
jgi:outer membrane protein assembly factor BamA